MIKKLQVKFIIITMLAITVISGSILALILYDNYKRFDNQTDFLMRIIEKHEGKIPENIDKEESNSNYINKETPFSTRFFTFEIDDSGKIINSNLSNIATITENDIEGIVNKVSNSGFYNNYKYKVVEKRYSNLYIFLDCTMQLNEIKHTTQNSILIVIIILIIVSIVVSLLSKKILKPITDNIEKQKQFITNASHELKTPLAVITSDVDILEMTLNENNEWLSSIKTQTNNLNNLIKGLLNLAKAEEGSNYLEKTEFKINELIEEQIKNYKSILKDKNIEFNNQDVVILADKNMTNQLLLILLDNAIKYTPDKGKIKIDVIKTSKYVKFAISNECENIDDINTDRLFERFYRDDKSRNKKKEGYGIGLSIAKSIVDVHHGKIKAFKTKNRMICFEVII